MREELHVIFKGRVQGVGFRWAVADSAERLHLVGTVRNVPDGTVEACVQGSKEELEKFLHEVEVNAGFARIDSTACEYRKPTLSCSSFKIIV